MNQTETHPFGHYHCIYWHHLNIEIDDSYNCGVCHYVLIQKNGGEQSVCVHELATSFLLKFNTKEMNDICLNLKRNVITGCTITSTNEQHKKSQKYTKYPSKPKIQSISIQITTIPFISSLDILCFVYWLNC